MGLLGCGRCLLIGFNIFWTILGLVLLGLGAAVKFAQDLVQGLLKKFLDTLPSSSGITAQAASEFMGLINKISIPLIVIGVILFLIGIFGCCGACYKNRIMLIIYAAVVGLVVLTEVIAIIVIVAMKDTVKTKLGVEFKSYIDKYYNDQAADIGSLLLNMGMMMGQCCGLNDYRDFDGAKNWDRIITVDGANVTKATPIACCKLKNPGFKMGLPAQSDWVNVTCIDQPDSTNSNYKTVLLFACAVLIIKDESD
ncbi:CD63 antigen-like isoform X2 [Tubulanus polymorphus]|uniref:CD63 antigen-like isoform X2 n=1 Tax=Tubulanus polymorphus TaxID=672921 RepID=UPI003DA42ED3